jgi:hypothetical protein
MGMVPKDQKLNISESQILPLVGGPTSTISEWRFTQWRDVQATKSFSNQIVEASSTANPALASALREF